MDTHHKYYIDYKSYDIFAIWGFNITRRTQFTPYTFEDHKKWDRWEDDLERYKEIREEGHKTHFFVCRGCMGCTTLPRVIKDKFDSMSIQEKKRRSYKLYQMQEGIRQVVKTMKLRLYLPRKNKIHTELIYSPFHPGKFFLRERIGHWSK